MCENLNPAINANLSPFLFASVADRASKDAFFSVLLDTPVPNTLNLIRGVCFLTTDFLLIG